LDQLPIKKPENHEPIHLIPELPFLEVSSESELYRISLSGIRKLRKI